MASPKRPMRRNSLIGPWGVGSIVPFPNDEALMIAGLDAWRYNTPSDFRIQDERLEKRLGVKELRWPPDFRDKSSDPQNFNLRIPAVRFPTWYYCPFCGSMTRTSLYSGQPECDAYQWKKGRKCNPKGKHRKMIPERFIVACKDGHVDDFPIAEWVHYDSGHEYDPNTCRVRRSTGGISSSLSGVFYECTCGAKKSMAGATNPGALEKIGYTCKGLKPWLGIVEKQEKPCNSEPHVILRGATNVWFGNVRSSIRIPTNDQDASPKIIAIVDEYYETLSNSRIDGELNKQFITMIAQSKNVDGEELYQAFVARSNNEEALSDVSQEMTEDEYRLAEYRVLCENSGSDKDDFHSINFGIEEYDESIREFFDSISLVPKLKETRALIGFSRLEPKETTIEESKKMLRLGNENWLPAIEVYGEGIFFEFNSKKIKEWAQQEKIAERIKRMSDAYKNSFSSRWSAGELRPEFVLIHTFAHLLINQLSFECGYSSSSIRERIYCEQNDNQYEMYGVLIYTASGDSEGSLGGLVRQGEKGRIEDTILSALKNALWCSADPICIQSYGQGPDSCNLAACHNCALLPETCCEMGNRLLDRGVIIGTLESTEMGYFSKIREL